MIKFLLASHGNLADGMYNSLEMIMGKQDNIFTLCVYTKEKFDLKEAVLKIINELPCQDKLIVITDLFGGSVNNEFMNNLGRKNIYLVSGLSLPLVIELIANQQNKDIDALISTALKDSQSSIRYCNKIVDSIQEGDDF